MVFAFITTKNNKNIHYQLIKKDDGVYIMENSIIVKKVASSDRNYMQNEEKFWNFFRQKRKEYKDNGNYKRDSENYSGAGDITHVSSYYTKPKPITNIKKYGMNTYNLGFKTYDNVEKDAKGQYLYNTIYYNIQWKPTPDGKRIFIEKSSYDKTGKNKYEILSREVNPEIDKAGIKELISQFRELYNREKKLREKFSKGTEKKLDEKFSSKNNDMIYKKHFKKR